MRWALILGVVALSLLAGCTGTRAGVDESSSTLAPRGERIYFDVMDTGLKGYEPSIGVDGDGRIFIAGVTPFPDQLDLGSFPTGVIRSTDDGATWQVVNVFPITYDPILHVDPVTDRVYRAHMLETQCTSLAWSDDGGTTWAERPAACGSFGVDFIKLGSGVPGRGRNAAVDSSTSHVLYLCHNRNGDGLSTSRCAMSYDGGLTWPVEALAADRARDGCGGVTSFPAVGPDGTAVVPLGSGCSALFLAISDDSGASWTVEALPFDGGAAVVTPRAAFDEEGRLYVLWVDWASRVHIAVREPGADWSRSTLGFPNLGGVAQVTMEVLGPGLVGFAFFGATGPWVNPSDAPAGTLWDLYGGIWRSDGSVVWDVEEEVQVGRICYGGGGCTRNLGDFFDAAAGPDGSFLMAYVDGCDACGQDQSTGMRLKVLRIAPADAQSL